MGSAYRARDVSLNRDVAIKVMRKSYGDDPAFVDAFRHEAQATAVLNHPNVVQIYSFGSAHGQPFLVMELVRGGSLHEMIMRGVKLDQSTVMRIAGDVATGLQHGYQFHLVHGDIKPENILLDVKGTAKIVDFGIAQLAGRNATEVWGTPYYVAPETVRRQRTDCRADIYSLGGTIFHALAGKPPFDGEDTTAVVKARFMTPAPPLRELRPDIDPEIETIVARMLQVDPVMRYPTYESLLGDIHHYLDRVKASAGNARKTGKIVIRAGATSTGHLPAMPPEKPKRRWLIYLLLGVGVLGLAGAGFVAWRFLKHQNYVATATSDGFGDSGVASTAGATRAHRGWRRCRIQRRRSVGRMGGGWKPLSDPGHELGCRASDR